MKGRRSRFEFRASAELRREFASACRALGITPSEWLRLFMQRTIEATRKT